MHFTIEKMHSAIINSKTEYEKVSYNQSLTSTGFDYFFL